MYLIVPTLIEVKFKEWDELSNNHVKRLLTPVLDTPHYHAGYSSISSRPGHWALQYLFYMCADTWMCTYINPQVIFLASRWSWGNALGPDRTGHWFRMMKFCATFLRGNHFSAGGLLSFVLVLGGLVEQQQLFAWLWDPTRTGTYVQLVSLVWGTMPKSSMMISSTAFLWTVMEGGSIATEE